jgi:hypothetical protein
MCNIKIEDFEKNGVNFKKHIEQEHNVRDYLMYIYILQKKSDSSVTGLESYVINKIDTNDLTWLPLTKSLSIEKNKKNL